ncbi:phosphotransferase system PTS lactose/cellobiose-specific IIA subunit [Thermoanaerobacter mathranii subsp. mathranii str. A3]|jgi:PTS system cellobiose-specific IIA component|uniref:Phosphotransferase system PTS lactose/cellobiose-specific IIA subunit n=1 Tax=Thermoanaerobacter mathranii subsp. mathranii (strain DSM 11426 / CCUG 53645 / CIP 108742 / A3) TaxID=583358 RepID=A0ABM5LNT5_THEM3|nr:PTS lactose/cellobiose transporter subunit IIA [Thermoanaerobacter mathranii]ADH60413.1 phosphotransferase system PTS lactose/cellobiose-specific IIA subunit [Thermoanaerobacter mathranii subsp. mathranii str. A3]
MEYEEIVMQIIVSGGNARTHAMTAIQYAKAGNIAEARKEIEKACEELNKAHEVQTKLIQDEAAGNAREVTLLMVHAQDHLMNAMTVKDLAQEFIDMYERQLKLESVLAQ